MVMENARDSLQMNLQAKKSLVYWAKSGRGRIEKEKQHNAEFVIVLAGLIQCLGGSFRVVVVGEEQIERESEREREIIRSGGIESNCCR